MRVPERLKEEVSGHLGGMDGGCILSKENCPPPGYTLPEELCKNKSGFKVPCNLLFHPHEFFKK